MPITRRWPLFAVLFGIITATPVLGQANLNVDNTIKANGSFNSSNVDMVNLQNGNLILHIPLPGDPPQRGGKIAVSHFLTVSAKTWQVLFNPTKNQNLWTPTGGNCGDVGIPPGPYPCIQGKVFLSDASLQMTRTYQSTSDAFGSFDQSLTDPQVITTWDGTGHQLVAVATNGTNATVLATYDGSGYRVEVGFGSMGAGSGTIIDRQGNRYSGNFVLKGSCKITQGVTGGIEGSQTSTETCNYFFTPTSITDTNGNIYNASLDTLNRPTMGMGGGINASQTGDLSGCYNSFGTPWVQFLSYPAPNAVTNQIKLCYAPYASMATNFSQPNTVQIQTWDPNNQPIYLTNVFLPDGTQWQLAYDSYGEITSLTTPTGASITYTWREVASPSCGGLTQVSRAVATRTIQDVNGNRFTWTYHWGAQASDGSLTNSVTDPNGNETVHKFTIISASAPPPGYCNFYETATRVYQGPASANQLVKAIDTTYQVDSSNRAVLPTAIQTTIYPGGLVSLVQKFYDTGDFLGVPTVSDLTQELEYDFGAGAHGPLLRQTDTVYQWQADTAGSYKTANLLNLPASTVVCSPNDPTYNPTTTVPLPACASKLSSGFTKLAETDSGYDDPTLLTSSGVTTQHGAAPSSVRGNPTSTSRWLNTNNFLITSNVNWFDTGVPAQTVDPMGHKSTISYSSTFAGAYATGACDPLQHCVSADYDFNTGLLASFTDANAPANTTKYGYDFLSRLNSVIYPDGGSATINHPDAITTEVLKPITSSLTDDSFSYSDGLGHIVKAVHDTPQCQVTVQTTYDGLGHPVTATNPYCSTSDPTYGVTTNQYDAVGRVTQTTKQDGGIVTSSYNANCATNADETGKVRRLCNDALGRLLEVDEPNVASQGTSPTAALTISGQLADAPFTGGTPHTAAAGSPLSSVVMPDGTAQTFYFDGNRHVNRFYWNSSKGWINEDLTVITNNTAAGAGSGLASALMNDGSIHVFYIGSNQHIYQLYWYSNAGWANQDITAINTGSGLAATGSKLSVVAPASGPIPIAVYYEASNQHIYQWYWSPSAGWQNQDLTLTTGNGSITAAVGSAITAGIMNDGSTQVFYVGANQHIYQLACCNPAWNNYDVTSFVSGSLLAASNSSLTMLTPPAGAAIPITVLYEGTNQHIDQLYWSPSAGWQNQDLTASTNNVLAVPGSALTSTIASGSWFVAYTGAANQHVYVLSCCGSPAWANTDLNVAAGSTVAAGSGSGQSSVGAANNLFMHEFYIGGNGHIYDLFYNAGVPAWQNVDLNATKNDSQLDAGTVTLNVGGFNATACFGPSTDSSCSTQQQDYSSSDVAGALAAAINVPSSPATAVVSGASISLIWKSPGTMTPAIGALSTTHDNPALFPNPSFTSPATTFSGGTGPGLDSTEYVTLYTYDGLGNLLTVTQKGGTTDQTQWRARTFQYDSLSRLTSARNPEAGPITYSYNADSLVIGRDRPRANQADPTVLTHTTYGYDSDHHLTSVSYGDATGTNAVFNFSETAAAGLTIGNPIDRLTSQSNGSSSEAFSYDSMGRILTIRDIIGSSSKDIGYTYNLNGSLAKLINPSGAVVTYTPDSAGQILSAVDVADGINYVTQATYNAPGEITGYINGAGGTTAGITNSFSYNPRLQPVFLQASTPAQTVFSIGYDFHLGQGDNGDVFQRLNNLDPTRTQSFTYDSLNRLSTAQTAGTDCTQTTAGGQSKFWGSRYGYDPWGNLLSKSVSQCSAPPLNVSVAANNRIAGFGYDAAGNMLNTGTGTATYTYDAESRITSVGGYTYGYDASENRIFKSAGGTGTLYWYGLPGIVAESDLAGNIQHEYAFFGGARIARRDSSGKVSYFFSDFLHSANVITDATGNVLSDSDYLPWGEEQVFKNSFDNHFKFTGKERDPESGLDDFGARFYANALGRFVSADWSAVPVAVPYAELGDPQTLNLYGYVRDLPTTRFDLDGHFAINRPGSKCANDSGVHCKEDKDKDAEVKDESVVKKSQPVYGGYFTLKDGHIDQFVLTATREVFESWTYNGVGHFSSYTEETRIYEDGTATATIYNYRNDSGNSLEWDHFMQSSLATTEVPLAEADKLFGGTTNRIGESIIQLGDAYERHMQEDMQKHQEEMKNSSDNMGVIHAFVDALEKISHLF